MTKPIEWRREIKSTETTIIRTRIAVQELDRYGSTIAVFAATPADIVAALAAMPLGDRETVLSASWNGIVMRGDYEHMVKERNEATARAEKAEAEITEVRRVLGVRENEVTASTAAWRMGEIAAATFCAEKAERECARQRERADQKAAAHRDLAVAHRKALLDLDKARLELDRVRASLDVVRHDLDGTRQELREAREDRDSLRARLIAAESAAAAREPREYPLAEGSPPPSIDPERLDLVRRALSGYVDPDQSPEQAARVAVEVADAALAIMRGLV